MRPAPTLKITLAFAKVGQKDGGRDAHFTQSTANGTTEVYYPLESYDMSTYKYLATFGMRRCNGGYLRGSGVL